MQGVPEIVSEVVPGSRSLARFLVVLGLAAFGLTAVSLVLGAVDGRQLLGTSVWAKPAKFGAAVGALDLTLALVIPLMPLGRRAGRHVVALVGALTAMELVLITLQAARGVPSHFNNATTFDRVVFQVMGAGIAVAALALGYLAVRAFRARFADRALGWGIRLGFVSMLLGSAVGGLMPRPTPAQLESLSAGRPTPAIGAHAVGVPDGGPGLPVTGWSVEGGDLRVPHFVGLHGFQVLPLVGWVLGRARRRRIGVERAARLAVAAGVGYLGLVAATLVQALRGRPLVDPDPVTLAVAGLALAAAVALAVAPRLRGVRPARAPAPLDVKMAA
jgi:hypothetical protein